MEQFYLEIRSLHIGAVIASGLLFFVRACGHNLLAARWPGSLWLRILTWTIDTTLLTAALLLMTIVQQFPFADGWLTMKVLLLVGYILLGSFAFRGKTKTIRLASMGAALAVYAFIITIARAHSPLGIFSLI